MDEKLTISTSNTGTTSRVQIWWEGAQFALHSFAHVNRELCLAMLRLPEFDLMLLPDEPQVFDPNSIARYAPLVNQMAKNRAMFPDDPLSGTRIYVRHQYPLRKIRPPKAAWVIYHPWEYSRTPIPNVRTLGMAKEIWTTSQFSAQSMIDSGVPAKKIHIIPNGVNLEMYSPEGPRAELPSPKPFRFLFVGGTIYRKGVDLLLQAYGKAFTARDPVSLVIKDYAENQVYRGQTGEGFIGEFMKNPSHPEVVYLRDFRSNREMAELYRACDVFVSSYRGEGFCLPALEAMACGRPAMVTMGGSTDDFVTGSSGWHIPAGLSSVGNTIFNLPVEGEAHLLNPDIDALVELMREAHRNESSRRAKGLAAANAAHDWTWDRAAVKVLARCQSLKAASVNPDNGA